jgi:hypothetical protein
VLVKCKPAVPQAMLKKIWKVVDSTKGGRLDQQQLTRVLGLVVGDVTDLIGQLHLVCSLVGC